MAHNKQLPFWMSPWRVATRHDIPHYVCDVAKSRSSRHEQCVELAPVAALREFGKKRFNEMMRAQLADALKTLGLVTKESDQRKFKPRADAGEDQADRMTA